MEKAKKVVVTLHRTKIRVKNIFSKKFARIKYNLYPHLKIRRFLLGEGYTGKKWSIFGWGRGGEGSGFLETAIINFVSQLLVDSLFTC